MIKELSDEEALDDSMRENLDSFRSNLNPVTRAKALQRLMDSKKISLRDLARLWRVPTANLSDWMQVLKLSSRMQDTLTKGKIFFTDALKLARMNMDEQKQNELSEIAEASYDKFKTEVERMIEGKEKRGIPEGKYEIIRIVFDKTKSEDSELYRNFIKLAEVTQNDPIELLKKVLRDFMERSKESDK